MKSVKITAIRQHVWKDLMEEYENPLDDPCCVKMGESWISRDALMPDGFCPQAWQSLYPFVFALASGGSGFFDGWMKDENSAMVSCNDGFRPVTFLVEAMPED